MKNFIQMLKFLMFSISAGIIEVVVFTLLNEIFNLEYWPAYLTALILSVLWNFTFNRRYTFKSTANVPVAMAKVFGFYLIFTPLSTWLGQLAESSGVNEYIVLAVTLVCNLIFEYLFCKFVVYKNEENNR